MAQSELEMTNSSTDDEEPSTDSESESDITPPPPPASTKTHSSEDSESDADSDPNQSQKPDPNIKPLASKPMYEELKPKNPNFLNSHPPVNGKRKASEVEDEGTDSKTANISGEKKPMFQRLWSEEDEIVLIKGMISYVETKGKDPIADVTDFHEFVKDKLNVDVKNGQMTAKVKRLKAKFKNNVGRFEKDGKVRSLSNPHEKKMYELSEKLWGGGNSNGNAAAAAALVSCSSKKVNPKLKAKVKVKEDQKVKGNSNPVVSGEAVVIGKVESGKSVVGLRGGGIKIAIPITDEDIMNRGLELLSGAKKVELEKKWNDLKVEELKHYMKKMELLKEQGELVLNAIKKSGTS